MPAKAPPLLPVTMAVLHYTGMRSAQEAIGQVIQHVKAMEG